MRVGDLERLYDYHYWATKKLLGVVAQLTPEQFTQSVAGSYGSIRNTLVHILSAEWGWLERCGGPPRGPRLNPDDYATLESLSTAWTRVEGFMRAFLKTLGDEDLALQVEFAFPDIPARALPAGQLLQHGAMHAVHHRGQVALLLRTLGVAPGNFDLLFYDGVRAAESQPRARSKSV